MITNDSKSYLPYLNKLVDQYITLIINAVFIKPIDADYSALIKKIETNP